MGNVHKCQGELLKMSHQLQQQMDVVDRQLQQSPGNPQLTAQMSQLTQQKQEIDAKGGLKVLVGKVAVKIDVEDVAKS